MEHHVIQPRDHISEYHNDCIQPVVATDTMRPVNEILADKSNPQTLCDESGTARGQVTDNINTND